MVEKRYNFKKGDATSTLTIVSSITKTEVVIDTDVIDSWYYDEKGNRIPVKTHHEKRTMIISNTEKSLKVLQTIKIDACYNHSHDCPVPCYNEKRRKITDSRIAFDEPIPKGEDIGSMIMVWVKCYIEDYAHILTDKDITVEGYTVDEIRLSEKKVIYAE
jgi:hypothetical protein